jgi:hypothetical protein
LSCRSSVFLVPLFLLGTLLCSTSARAQASRSFGATANWQADSGQSHALPLKGYAGDNACRSCHRDQFDSYRSTAHHFTSQPPGPDSIAGSFAAGSNVLHTSNPYLSFSMEARPDGFFQSAIVQLPASKALSHTERFDVVIGSGRKGQSYLYWKGDDLFELPVSYWTKLGSWINSPGYPDGSPRFDKPVIPRCLECHASSFDAVPGSLNQFKKGNLVLSITCERCHGPGGDHILHRSSKIVADQQVRNDIVNPARIARERQIDLCGLCHSGAGTPIAPALTFVAGDVLAQFLSVPDPGPNVPVDVHGNQVELLRRSRCFRSSNMTCTTCHDVHKPQRDAASFSSHCLACHKASDHPQLNQALGNDCVSCHMPLQKSETLVSDTNGHSLKPLVRNHQIGIYRESPMTSSEN